MNEFRLLVPSLVLTPSGRTSLPYEGKEVQFDQKSALVCYPDGSFEVLQRHEVFCGQFRKISSLGGKDLAGLYVYSTGLIKEAVEGSDGDVVLHLKNGETTDIKKSAFDVSGKVWVDESSQDAGTLKDGAIEVGECVESISRACSEKNGWDLSVLYSDCA